MRPTFSTLDRRNPGPQHQGNHVAPDWSTLALKLLNPQESDAAQEAFSDGIDKLAAADIAVMILAVPTDDRAALHTTLAESLAREDVRGTRIWQALLEATRMLPTATQLQALVTFAPHAFGAVDDLAALFDEIMVAAGQFGPDAGASVAAVINGLNAVWAPAQDYMAGALAVLAPLPAQSQASGLLALVTGLAIASASITDDLADSLRQHLERPGIWESLLHAACSATATPADQTEGLLNLATGLGKAPISSLAFWSDILNMALTLNARADCQLTLKTVADTAAGLRRMTAPACAPETTVTALWTPIVQTISALNHGTKFSEFLEVVSASRPPASIRVRIVSDVCRQHTVQTGVPSATIALADIKSLSAMLVKNNDLRTDLWLALATAAATGVHAHEKIEWLAQGAINAGVSSIEVWKRFISLHTSLVKIAQGLGLAQCADPTVWIGVLDRVRSEAPVLVREDMAEACIKAVCHAMKGSQYGALLVRVHALGLCFAPVNGVAPDWFHLAIAGRLGLAGMAGTAEGKDCLTRLPVIVGLPASAMQQLLAAVNSNSLLQLLPPLGKVVITVPETPNHYRAMLTNVKGGVLNLGQLPAVMALRTNAHQSTQATPGVQAIEWRLLESPGVFGPRKFCSFPQLAQAAGNFLAQIKLLALALDHSGQGAGAVSHKLQGLLSQIAHAPHLLNPQPWIHARSAEGLRQSVTMGAALLSWLIDGHHQVRPATLETLATAMSGIRAFSTNHSDLATELEAMEQCLTDLQMVMNSADFAERYSNCYFYRVAVLDKEPIEALLLGAQVACCLAPDGGQFKGMVERQLNPAWVHVGVMNDRNEVVAVSWCGVCKNTQTAQLHLVVDFTDAKPSLTRPEPVVGGGNRPNALGNALVRQLLAYVADLGKAAGFACTYAGPQRYGRMVDLPEFARSQYTHQVKLELVCHVQQTKHDYVDNIGRFDDKPTDRFRLLRPGQLAE